MKKKTLTLIFVTLMLIGLFFFIYLSLLIRSGYKVKPKDNASAIIILGAKVNDNPAVPSNVLEERLDAAITYLNENPKTIAIVSGGQGQDESESEATVMKRYLIEHGISKNRIDVEDRSTSTSENLQFSKQLVNPDKQIVICTSDFHMYRALLIAKQNGYLNVSGCISHSKDLAKYRNFVRELFALTKTLIQTTGMGI